MKFKIGDRVRCSAPYSWQLFKTGDVGIVVEEAGQDDLYIVRVGDKNTGRDDRCWSLLAAQMKLAPTKKRTEVEPGDERVGDIVCGNGKEFSVASHGQILISDRAGWMLPQTARALGFTIWREEPEVRVQDQVVCLDGAIRPHRASSKVEWKFGDRVWVSDRKPIKFEGDE